MSVIGEPIHLVPYDPAWPDMYAREAASLRSLTGGVLARMEHVGSTAVPGLSAKPTIDILASIATFAALGPLEGVLTQAGYRDLSQLFEFRRFYRKEARDGLPSFHLHLIEDRAWDVPSEVPFRDWLRADAAHARAYVALKQSLSQRFPDDRHAYNEGKAAFIHDAVNAVREDKGLPPRTDWTE